MAVNQSRESGPEITCGCGGFIDDWAQGVKDVSGRSEEILESQQKLYLLYLENS